MRRVPNHKQIPAGNLKSELQTITPSLIESLKMEIGHLGQMVYLQIGNHKLEMDYPSAIKLASLLRVHGKQAKKFAGDSQKIYTEEAVLTDAEMNYKKGW